MCVLTYLPPLCRHRLLRSPARDAGVGRRRYAGQAVVGVTVAAGIHSVNRVIRDEPPIGSGVSSPTGGEGEVHASC